MKINVNENYYINFDGNNYTPFKFVKGTGEEYKVAGKTIISKDKWVDSRKFFTTLESALKWIAIEAVQDGCEEISLDRYIKEYVDVMKGLTEACKGLK